MTAYQCLDVTQIGDVTVVQIRSHRIIEDLDVEQFGKEMFSLVEHDQRKKLLLNFSLVEFLNTTVVGKLIALQRKTRAHGGVLKLCNLQPKMSEVFAVFKLNRVFDIQGNESDALATFYSREPQH